MDGKQGVAFGLTLFQSDQWRECLVCEALEVKMEPRALNKDDTMKLSLAWPPALFNRP